MHALTNCNQKFVPVCKARTCVLPELCWEHTDFWLANIALYKQKCICIWNFLWTLTEAKVGTNWTCSLLSVWCNRVMSAHIARWLLPLQQTLLAQLQAICRSEKESWLRLDGMGRCVIGVDYQQQWAKSTSEECLGHCFQHKYSLKSTHILDTNLLDWGLGLVL